MLIIVVNFFLFSDDKMIETYSPMFGRDRCRDVMNILSGFLTTPPLNSTQGRLAFQSICHLCIDAMDNKTYSKFQPRNLGGGALGYEGSLTYARWVTFKIEISLTNCSPRAHVEQYFSGTAHHCTCWTIAILICASGSF